MTSHYYALAEITIYPTHWVYCLTARVKLKTTITSLSRVMHNYDLKSTEKHHHIRMVGLMLSKHHNSYKVKMQLTQYNYVL